MHKILLGCFRTITENYIQNLLIAINLFSQQPFKIHNFQNGKTKRLMIKS